MKNKELQRKVLKATDGILRTATDLVLFELHYMVATMECHDYLSLSRIAKKMDDSAPLVQNLGYDSIKRTLYNLKRQGLIDYVKEEGFVIPTVTAEGKNRLESIVPYYQETRPWTGKIYLVTYDIPESRKGQRDAFRNFITKIGCGKMQRSVWLTPYNPRELIAEFVAVNSIEGEIIISNIGKDGSIGRQTIKELVTDVYDLGKINWEYKHFINDYKEKEINAVAASRASIDYFGIIDKDPQLPFELLPLDWVGEKAYLLYKKFTKKYPVKEV